MNRISRPMMAIGVIIFVGLISWSIVVASNRANQDKPTPLPMAIRTPKPTRPAYCVPIPRPAQMSGTPTPTPDRLSTPIPHFSPSVTPIPFAHIYDLSPGLPLSEKSKTEIFRCNGTFDLYLAGPNVDIDQAIELNVGDIVYSSGPPASLMGHEPPTPTGSMLTQIPPASTPTSFPYPPPPTPIDSTPAPYPVPLTQPSLWATAISAITAFDSPSYITATSIQELANKSTIIMLGEAIERGDTINIARDVDDISKPDPNLFGVGQVYVFKVEQYLKGGETANETDLIYIVQPEGMLILTPNAPLTETEVEKAREHYDHIPIRLNTEYLLFLEPLRGFQDLKYHYGALLLPGVSISLILKRLFQKVLGGEHPDSFRLSR